ncbi:MAG: histidine kinase, partial [Actinobacteria bacterium]|nr:histidine kinase [Actinomycetota bacterium]
MGPEPALAATEAAGRTALAEMRRLLDVLRSDAASDPVAQLDLRRLEELLRGALPPPVDVSVHVDGDTDRVPRPVALTAYRIVQEALTNIAQHSDPEHVEVRIRSGEDELQLEIHDDGHPRKVDVPARVRLGILGMRERASLLGGTIEAGPRAGAGSSVVARLPFHTLMDAPEADDLLRAEIAPEGSATLRRSAPPPLTSRVRSGLRSLGRMGWPADVLLVVLFSIAAVLEIRGSSRLLGPQASSPNAFSSAAYVWAVAWIALLLLRRPAPVLTGLAMTVMAFLQTFPFRYWTPVADVGALQIAVYTIATRRPGRHAWMVAALGAVGLLSIPPPPVTAGLVGYLVILAVTLMGFAYIGTVVAERQRLIAEVEGSLAALGEARRAELALALHAERVALAREMHDLVAHTLSLMVVQAGAAR